MRGIERERKRTVKSVVGWGSERGEDIYDGDLRGERVYVI